MYPSLGSSNPMSQTTFKQHIPPSEAITTTIMELKQNQIPISSFKPHLNTYQCHLSLILNNKMSVPLKIVFLRNFPQERPIIFVTQWLKHPMVNECSCEVQYESEFPWSPSCMVLDLLKRIQSKFGNQFPTYESELDSALQQFDTFSRQVQSLRTKPGQQPPPPPQINLQKTLNTFEYQQNLYAQCQQKNSLYMMTAQEYNQNLARVRVMGEKFSKGKIIREMQKNIESEIHHHEYGSVLTLIQSYYENRKKLHKMKILKELYQES